MVMRPDVIANSLDNNLNSNEKIYFLSPRGKLLNQELAKKISKEKSLNILCFIELDSSKIINFDSSLFLVGWRAIRFSGKL